MRIQISSFKFKEYPSNNHWIDFARFGELTEYHTELFPSVDEVSLILNSEEVYQLSLDQSTSCSGIFIKNYRNTEAYMIEFYNGRSFTADDYIFNLEIFLHKIFDNMSVSHIIYEKPISSENFRSSQVLFQLEGIIRSLVKRYKEFKNARLDCIVNASWRKAVIPDDISRNYPKKEASKRAINEVFDWTNIYGYSLGTDNDIFEAMGVMFGWFFNSYDTLGRPYIRGEGYKGNIGGFILPNASAEDVSNQFNEMGIVSMWGMQNPKKSIYENLIASVEKYKVVCVEITEPYAMLSLYIECNIKWNDPERLCVVLVASNYVDTKLFKITGDTYHFIL